MEFRVTKEVSGLQLVQGWCRLLYFADWHDNVIPLFLEANVLPITFLCYESVSTLMHDINNDKAPANIKFISENVYCIHSYNAGLSTSGTFYG